MKDYKISKKLIAFTGLLFAPFLIIIAVFAYGLVISNTRLTDFYNNNFVAVEAVGNMKEALQFERSIFRNMVIYDADSDDYQSNIASLEQCKTDMQSFFDIYEKTIDENNTEDRELFDDIKNFYLGDFEDFKIGLQEITDADDVEGAIVYIKDTGAIGDYMNTSLDELFTLNGQLVSATLDEANSEFAAIVVLGLILILVAAVVSIVLVKMMKAMLADKITMVADAANTLAKGDVDINLVADSKDEVGDLINAFNHMVNGIKAQVSVVGALAKGDLTAHIEPRSEKDVMSLSLNRTIEALNRLFGDVSVAAAQVGVGAQQVSSAAQSLSEGATEQAGSVEELASTLSEITDTVKSNAETAKNAKSLSDKAANEVRDGNKQMELMLESITSINESSEEISKIIRVIDDIAFQTNILSLNAAVEAARAGMAGKGFAVVADEVRNLAAKSAEAAKNVSRLIETSIKNVSDGTKIADSTAETLKGIVNSVHEVSALITTIDMASEAQAESLMQINQGVDQISQVVQTTSATAEESAASSEELSAQADMLSEMVTKFKLK